MALISYPNVPAITYKGFGGFFSLNECEDKRIFAENMITNYEILQRYTLLLALLLCKVRIIPFVVEWGSTRKR